jgi:hypothetical protein
MLALCFILSEAFAYFCSYSSSLYSPSDHRDINFSDMLGSLEANITSTGASRAVLATALFSHISTRDTSSAHLLWFCWQQI